MQAKTPYNSREMTKLRLAKAVNNGLERGRKAAGLMKRIGAQVRATPVTVVQTPGIIINRIVEMLIGIATDVSMAHNTNLLRVYMNDDPATIYDFLEELQLADPEVVERFFDTFGAGGLETLLERAEKAEKNKHEKEKTEELKHAFEQYHRPHASEGTTNVGSLSEKEKRLKELGNRLTKAKRASRARGGKSNEGHTATIPAEQAAVV